MKIVEKNRPPRGGWRWMDLDTNVEIKGVDFIDLVRNVRQHRIANGLTATEEIETLIEEHYCATKMVPCRNEDGSYLPLKNATPRKVTAVANKKMMKRGTDAIIKTLVRIPKGTAFTSSVTANARATVCASCPMNITVKRKTCCGGDPQLNALKKIVNMAQSLNVKMRTHSDAALKTCSVCGCELKAKVWCSDEVIKETDTKDSLRFLPKDCWVREIVDEKS